MRRLVYILCFLSIGALSRAQQPGVRNFSATAFDNYVLVSWTTDSGYTCNNLRLHHSKDNDSFSELFIIPGVCGSLQEARSYTYIHNDPEPDHINYYQLSYDLILENFETSVYYRKTDIYSVFPNPVTTESFIYLDQTPTDYIFSVADLNGKTVWSETGKQEQIRIDATRFVNGYYMYQLTLDGRVISGKFLVNR